MNELNELSGLGNTKPNRMRYRRVCFTLNNWTDEEMNSMISEFDKISKGYIIGREIGDQGTPHLQGYVEFEKQLYITALKKINARAHWEKALGTKEQNIKYCSKDNDYTCTFKIALNRTQRLLKKFDNVEWKPWQQQVLDIVKDTADDRTIHWFWEPNGNVGKSFLCKYLYLKYDCIIADGKKDNIFNQIKTWLDRDGYEEKDPSIIIADVPRHNIDYINYGALEAIKNGLIYSGKYEGGVCAFDNPHLIIFANVPPNTENLSMDRWNIVRI